MDLSEKSIFCILLSKSKITQFTFFIFVEGGEDELIPEGKDRTYITKWYDFRCVLNHKQPYYVGKVHQFKSIWTS